MSTVLAEHTYERVLRLIPHLEAMQGYACSRVKGQPALQLAILEQTPYTTIFRLLQQTRVDGLPVPNPELELRVYHDLRVAEALRYRTRYGSGDWLSGRVHHQGPVGDKRELNFFLWKWLGHCLSQGHNLLPAPRAEALKG